MKHRKKYVHIKKIVHALVQVALLQGDPDWNLGVGIDRLTLDPSSIVGVSLFMDNLGASWHCHGTSQEAVEDDETDLHFALFCCY